MRLAPYPEYKENGAEWIGWVPRHWVVQPNRATFREIISKGHDSESLLSVTIQGGVIKQSVLLNSSSKKDSSNEDKGNYKLVEPGDIAYNKMRAWQGALGASSFRGIVSPAYIVVRPRIKQNEWFFHHLMRTPAFTTEAERWSYGITSDQWSLRSTDFKCIYCPVPPPNEQDQIVRFIRHIDHRVNKLIKAKKRLIELLNEQKQAIIHEAVTKGLDPDVPLKDSGIEWLGRIPEHWEEVRIKDVLINLNSQRVPLSGSERGKMTSRAYDYFGASGIIDKVDNYIFDDELLLVAEDGANLVLRNLPLAIIATGKFWVNNHAHILKPKTGQLFYWASLLELVDYRPWISGAAQPKLTKDRLMSIRIPCPPADEQLVICDEINVRTSGLVQMANRARVEIDLIREYRTRLVSDVVTGQLDVRCVQLPELEDEPIDLDSELDEEADEAEELEEALA